MATDRLFAPREEEEDLDERFISQLAHVMRLPGECLLVELALETAQTGVALSHGDVVFKGAAAQNPPTPTT